MSTDILPEDRYGPMPTPYSSTSEVRTWLQNYFQAQVPELGIEGATREALKIDEDGAGVYNWSIEDWTEIYGRKGKRIFNMLQSTKYGSVRRIFDLLTG